jgi:hypothetical protein
LNNFWWIIPTVHGGCENIPGEEDVQTEVKLEAAKEERPVDVLLRLLLRPVSALLRMY